ncbi:TATA box-binding protein-associated factor RNA polymerase I subunit C-like [Acipenser ruthenus]|uniref:TATA box-binding protein-associated factor RNA polymerase I subunit C-like n=1 Tax=Acipenser ruthenus TaxID=7906 RepID=UPI0027411FFF|nr:TATA box-binding protein-associated factor RNA polymerase I subunit C-like [Acipenser ruthenus]
MNNKFPVVQFPRLYNNGPPRKKPSSIPSVDGWGEYGHVMTIGTAQSRGADLKFEAQHSLKGEKWKPVEPVAVPLLSPNSACKVSTVTPADLTTKGKIIRRIGEHESLKGALDFTEHMSNFYLDNYDDAFSAMGGLLEEHLYFGDGSLKGRIRETTIGVSQLNKFLENMKYKTCPFTTLGDRSRLQSYLFGDSIYDIPPALLAENIHEEMALQRNRVLFDSATTGGALGYFPLEEKEHFQEGCLIYPSKAALNYLNFRKVVVEFGEEDTPKLSMRNKPVTFELNGTIRQISMGNVEEQVYVGVRSDYLCGVWRVDSKMKPASLQVIQTEQIATCINVSPHIPGEMLVVSESGAAYLWSLERGLNKIRHETENLHFNAQSSWRWCDFTAHPRVVTYADRSGVDLTDMRSPENQSQALFSIGEASECSKGERVILPKYLSDVNAYHYLITTQYSAYIVDERFPCLPVMKWEHMLESPPMFSQVLPGEPWNRSNKVLLATQRSQELLMLQYSGGTQLACQSLAPPRKLSSPPDCLKHLPVQIPHREDAVNERLGSHGAGLTALYHHRAPESLCVLQLSQAGDIFYQMLRHEKNPDEIAARNTETESSNKEPEENTGATQKSSVEQQVETVAIENILESDEEQGASHQLEIVVNDPEEQTDLGAQTEPQSGSPQFTQESGSHLGDDDNQPSTETCHLDEMVIPSRTALAKWKTWLKTFFKKQHKLPKEKKSLRIYNAKRIPNYRPTLENTIYCDVREKMKVAVKERKVLSSSTTQLHPLEIVTIPDPVDPSFWTDELSERLTASWEGRWSSWWEDKLGLNRDQKIEALRRKRKQQKQARARKRRGLSQSFTSSASYQSDLSDFSDFSGWSSAASSAGEASGPSSLPDTDTTSLSYSTQRSSLRAGTVATDNPAAVSDQETVCSRPSSIKAFPSLELPRIGTPRDLKRKTQDCLAALSEPQNSVEQDEDDSWSFPLASSSQRSSIPKSSQTNRLVIPSSQGSMMSSQPRKKKSRMGF